MADRTDISFVYQPGWALSEDFIDVLDSTFDQDSRRGFTHCGPHRADLIIRSAGQAAQESLSRGQQKLLICAMLIAQAIIYRDLSAKSCVILIDDLKAELDQEHVERVMSLLKGLDVQTIMTATDKEVLKPFCYDGYKMFHVERGCVTEVV